MKGLGVFLFTGILFSFFAGKTFAAPICDPSECPCGANYTCTNGCCVAKILINVCGTASCGSCSGGVKTCGDSCSSWTVACTSGGVTPPPPGSPPPPGTDQFPPPAGSYTCSPATCQGGCCGNNTCSSCGGPGVVERFIHVYDSGGVERSNQKGCPNYMYDYSLSASGCSTFYATRCGPSVCKYYTDQSTGNFSFTLNPPSGATWQRVDFWGDGGPNGTYTNVPNAKISFTGSDGNNSFTPYVKWACMPTQMRLSITQTNSGTNYGPFTTSTVPVAVYAELTDGNGNRIDPNDYGSQVDFYNGSTKFIDTGDAFTYYTYGGGSSPLPGGSYNLKAAFRGTDWWCYSEGVNKLTVNQTGPSCQLSVTPTTKVAYTGDNTIGATITDQSKALYPGKAIYSINWDGTSVQTSGSTSNSSYNAGTHVYNTAGTYNIKATIKDVNSGKTGSACTDTVTITNKPVTPMWFEAYGGDVVGKTVSDPLPRSNLFVTSMDGTYKRNAGAVFSGAAIDSGLGKFSQSPTGGVTLGWNVQNYNYSDPMTKVSYSKVLDNIAHSLGISSAQLTDPTSCGKVIQNGSVKYHVFCYSATSADDLGAYLGQAANHDANAAIKNVYLPTTAKTVTVNTVLNLNFPALVFVNGSLKVNKKIITGPTGSGLAMIVLNNPAGSNGDLNVNPGVLWVDGTYVVPGAVYTGAVASGTDINLLAWGAVFAGGNINFQRRTNTAGQTSGLQRGEAWMLDPRVMIGFREALSRPKITWKEVAPR